MGLDEIVVRDLVKHPQRRDELLGTSAVIGSAAPLLLVLLVLAATLLEGHGWSDRLARGGDRRGGLLRPFSVIDFHFMAQVKADRAVHCQNGPGVGERGLQVPVDRTPAPLIWFAWTYVLETLVLSVGYVVAYARDRATVRAWRYTREMAGYLLGQSWPLVIYGMALCVQAKIDR